MTKNKKNLIYLLQNSYTYLVKISYDGTNFHGWAAQPKLRTIEGEINKALKKVFHLEIKISGSSRTDSGVHAFEQFFTFCLPNYISINEIKKILNQTFKKDIKVLEVKLADNNFNIRKAVAYKEYRYIINSGERDVFKTNYQYFYGKPLIKQKLQQVLNLFIGKHNFFNFSGLKASDRKNPYRSITKIKVKKHGKKIIIIFIGQSFLRYQIRYLISSAIYYQDNKISIDEIKNYLTNTKTTKYQFPKVPACGLYLYKTTLKN